MIRIFDGGVQAWKKVGKQRIVGQGFGVAIVQQKYQRPDGSLKDFDFLSRRKTGITVFALTPEGLIIVKEEFKSGTDRICWESAAALIDSETGETPLEAAHRELREETGHKAHKLTLLPEDCVFGEGKYDYGYRLTFALDCYRVGDPIPTGDEVAFSVYYFTPEEFWEAVNTKQIRACQTIHAAHAAASVGLIIPNPALKF